MVILSFAAFVCLFVSQPWVVFSHVCTHSYSAEGLRVIPYWSLKFFLCAILSSKIIRPGNSRCYGLPGLPTLSPQENVWTPSWCPSNTVSWNFSLGSKLGQLGGLSQLLTLFLWSLSYVVQYSMSASHCFRYFIQFPIVSGRKVFLVSITLCYLEAEFSLSPPIYIFPLLMWKVVFTIFCCLISGLFCLWIAVPELHKFCEYHDIYLLGFISFAIMWLFFFFIIL